jgi:phosphoglycerol transferase MdoB-like AlkP superfamily enzyme
VKGSPRKSSSELEPRRLVPPTATVVYLSLQPCMGVAFGAPIAWVATTAFLSFSIFFAGAGFSDASRRMWFVGGATFLLALGNGLLGASYYLQATGFNRVYFDHFNLNTANALPVYGDQATLALVYLIVGVLLSIWAARQMLPRPFSWAMPALIIGASVLFTPVWQAAAYFIGQKHSEQNDHDLAKVLRANPGTLAPKSERPKNLVLIYMEGLEQSYFDVPDLMPRLTELRRRITRFSDVHDLMGSTIGGLVSTLCGWPFLPSPGFYRDKHFLPGMRCLGDDLEDHGYTSTFMGGADLHFTRKDTLFGDHGFSKVLGAKALLPRVSDPSYKNRWGLEDDSLFDLARDEFSALSKRGTPFALVLLTVGTHVPGYVARSCPHYVGSDNVLLQAVHCTDALVADFVEFIRASEVSEDTVIAILSDHLMWKGIRSQGLTTAEEDRRMTFLLDRPGQSGREVAVTGSGFDVGATISDAIGIESNGRLGVGSSLLRGRGALWTSESGLDGKESIYDFVHSDEMRSRFNAYRRSTPSE